VQFESLAPARRLRESKVTMKKTRSDEGDELDDLLPEYEFDYKKAKPNRFALTEQQRVVILEPDVAEYFRDSEAVNRVLRALIEVMPREV